MILYNSTRNQDKKSYTFSEAILRGIAEDGGLLVPDTIPTITPQQMQELRNKSYQEIAAFVFSQFAINLPFEIFSNLINRAYSDNFDHQAITPVVPLTDQQYILELWHGPTLAFKDLALQIMPLFFEEAVKNDNQQKISRNEQPLKYLILVSTSGDTGKAAIEGYKDKKDISIMALYPDQRVSSLQERQMVTQEGNNVSVYALDGDFDALQEIAKNIFNDVAFNEKLLQQQHAKLSSANSINWGRLMPQIVYYLSSYLYFVKNNIITNQDFIDVAVPTGNFGNILAAFYAKKMGIPIRKLICAVNENHVLADFLNTGTYDISNRSLSKTPSPSMDILIASNIERLLYILTEDSVKMAHWMNELKSNKKFTVDDSTLKELQSHFVADWITNDNSLVNIKRIYDKTGYLMDPHTSVAQAVVESYVQQSHDKVPVLICGTAHWSKFPHAVYEALHNEKTNLDDFTLLDKISASDKNLSVPKNMANLKDKTVRHNNKLPAKTELVKEEIVKWLEK